MTKRLTSLRGAKQRGNLFITITLIFFISSCSIQTLHSHNKKIHSKLSQVNLSGIEGKNKYLIRKAFQDEFYINAADVTKPKKYLLNIKVTDNVGDWLIQKDSTILRKSLTVHADFQLMDFKTNKLATTGNAKSLITFSESPSAWSSYISSEKAYENAVRDVMRSVRIKISLFLTSKKENENNSKQHKKIS